MCVYVHVDPGYASPFQNQGLTERFVVFVKRILGILSLTCTNLVVFSVNCQNDLNPGFINLKKKCFRIILILE